MGKITTPEIFHLECRGSSLSFSISPISPKLHVEEKIGYFLKDSEFSLIPNILDDQQLGLSGAYTNIEKKLGGNVQPIELSQTDLLALVSRGRRISIEQKILDQLIVLIEKSKENYSLAIVAKKQILAQKSVPIHVAVATVVERIKNEIEKI